MKESKFLALIASTGIALISSETQAANHDFLGDEEISRKNTSAPSIFDLRDERENSPNNNSCSNNGCSGGGSNSGCGGGGGGWGGQNV